MTVETPEELAQLIAEKFGGKFKIRVHLGEKYVWIFIQRTEVKKDGSHPICEEATGAAVPTDQK